jgi:hypothetical protein
VGLDVVTRVQILFHRSDQLGHDIFRQIVVGCRGGNPRNPAGILILFLDPPAEWRSLNRLLSPLSKPPFSCAEVQVHACGCFFLSLRITRMGVCVPHGVMQRPYGVASWRIRYLLTSCRLTKAVAMIGHSSEITSMYACRCSTRVHESEDRSPIPLDTMP